jgi:hypothetical protein
MSQKHFTLKSDWLAWTICAVVLSAAGLFFMHTLHKQSHRGVGHGTTPWQCVGGCGAGGAGGTAADIKWIGQGVSGGLIDAEVMTSATWGENFD